MSSKILDGKGLAYSIRNELKLKVADMEPKPGLAVILVGSNSASETYVSGKEKAAQEIGYIWKKILLDENVSQQDLMHVVDELNQDKSIHGFIVQLPLPNHINSQLIIDGILPHKDADGFSPVNLGSLLIGHNAILPATPKGIIRLLTEYKIPIEGQNAVVIGRSNIVGKPISFLLQQRNATVTMCHSKTKNLKDFTKHADILISCAGIPKLITKDMVKSGAVVIDVGINKTDDGMVGDVDFEAVSKKASYITPVPGGVGPMTIAMLLENTLQCYNIYQRL